jgi:hypothetical protein
LDRSVGIVTHADALLKLRLGHELRPLILYFLFFTGRIVRHFKLESAAPRALRTQLHKVGEHTLIVSEKVLLHRSAGQDNVIAANVLYSNVSLEGVDLLAGHQNLQQDWSLAMALSPLPGHQRRRILNFLRLVLLKLSVGDECIVLCSHQLLRHRQIEKPGGITVHEFTRDF